jgi:SAM-dependent methyltransferase
MPISIKNLHKKLIALAGSVSNKTILDYGCGHGGTLDLLLQGEEPLKSIIAVDSDEKMVQKCLNRFSCFINDKKLTVLQRADPMSLSGQSFDIIFCHNVLECITQKEIFVRNLFNLLSPDGTLVLSQHDWDSALYNSSFKDLTRKLIHFFADAADTTQEWQNYHDGQIGRKIPGIFSRAGIKDTEIDTWRMVETSFECGDYGFLMCAMIMAVCKDKFTQQELALWKQDLIVKAQNNDYYFAIDVVVAKSHPHQ